MRTILRLAACRLGAYLLLSLLPFLASSEGPAVDNQLALTSLAVQGTNLTLVGVVPPGLGQVTLEMRPTFGAPWAAAGWRRRLLPAAT